MIIANDEEESEGSKKWSDRALMNKYGNITGILVEEREGNSIGTGGYIQRIRARCLHSPFPPIPFSRYGREEEGWSQWRETATQSDNPTIHRVELGANIHLEGGYSEDNAGVLSSLAVTNLDDGTRRVFGKHDKYGRSLRELPPVVQSKLVLTHLSGEEKYEDYSLCFNYE